MLNKYVCGFNIVPMSIPFLIGDTGEFYFIKLEEVEIGY